MNKNSTTLRNKSLLAAAAFALAAAAAPAFADETTTTDDGMAVTVSQTTWTVQPMGETPITTATAATLPQWQQPPITRESVRAELMAARAAGTLTPDGEVGDTTRVLAAREQANQDQTNEIVAYYQTEYDRQVALQEAEIRRAAIEADWLANGVAQNPSSYDDPTAEVQIDVISMQPLGVGE